MKQKRVWGLVALLLVLAVPAFSAGPPTFKLGEMAPEFTLASTQGKFDYVDQVYGRHHLILTFFPAAFTPV